MAHTSTTRSAIVIGASRGIGRAVATRLARDGFAVAVNYAGNASKAEEVVAEIFTNSHISHKRILPQTSHRRAG